MKVGASPYATESVCPVCLRRLSATRETRGEEVFLVKVCPEHGRFETVLWRGAPERASWERRKVPSRPERPVTSMERGCPFDCGLCPEHRQHTCTALLEVTRRCNLRCTWCFADAGGADAPEDPGIETVERWYHFLLKTSGPCNVQLSGGEPTVRDDLPEIIARGRSLGFPFIQLNTNGLRLARDPGYAERLAEAGLASVFLQFDGLDDANCAVLRGRPLAAEKVRAVERCADARLGVVLVPTLVPGVNTGEIGAILDFAVAHARTVRGVHFQPVSHFGRTPGPPSDADRVTIPEVLREIERQTDGRMRVEHFAPPGCENAFCSFHGNFVVLPGGEVKSWGRSGAGSCCSPVEIASEGAEKARNFVGRFWSHPEKAPVVDLSGPSLGGWDVFLERVRTHALTVSGMAFQDAWNLDLDRLRDCCIHVVTPNERLVPFCAHNLSDASGRPMRRGPVRANSAGSARGGA